jgi:hypothetical protein
MARRTVGSRGTVDEKQTVRGKIAVVDEQRFRLVTDNGQTLLLTLAEKASLDGKDLQRLHRAGVPVEVEYTGDPNLDSGVAYKIK